MKKYLVCFCLLSLCATMLSACGFQAETVQTQTASNTETTVSAEETSETTTAATEVTTEITTEETEAEPEINYQKKRVVTYPVDGDSYVSTEYEYGDDGYYKETNYNSDGTLSHCYEYKNDIKIKYTGYRTGVNYDGTGYNNTDYQEYNESQMNYITKLSESRQYDDNRTSNSEALYDYQFNDDFTEALVTVTNTIVRIDLDGKEDTDEFEYTYIQYYEYDDSGRIIHKYQYDEERDLIDLEDYFEYDDNGNIIMFNSGFSTSIYDYDDNDNLTHYNYSSDYRASDTYYDYDEYGRQIGWTEYDADGNETSHSVVEYE